MVAGEHLTWHGSLVKNGQGKYGFYVGCMMPRLLWTGLINAVVPYEKLEMETVQWCQEILEKSPLSLRLLKGALNADCDGQAGLQQFAGDATMLFYMTEEAQEGRDAFKEKRKPKFEKFPRLP